LINSLFGYHLRSNLSRAADNSSKTLEFYRGRVNIQLFWAEIVIMLASLVTKLFTKKKISVTLTKMKHFAAIINLNVLVLLECSFKVAAK
jgi:hypothetical protein